MSDSENAVEIIGYCLKCKEKRPMTAAAAEWAANGSPATRGKCTVCGTNMYLRGRTAAHEHLPKPVIVPGAKKKKKATAKKRKSKKKKAVRRSGKLVIVESPAKSRTIGKYLGRGYKVMSSVGHVRDLLRSRLSVDVDNGYTPEYRVPNDKRPLVRELKAAAAKAKEIYLATDQDREGEAIAWHVMESAEMEPARVQRVVFNEITKKAILAAFENPRDINMAQVDAQQARRILDRLVGYKLSPLLWRKVRGRLSAGRVQSVALRLVVERERAIEAFEPVEYWTVAADLGRQANKGSKTFKANLLKVDGAKPILSSEAVVKPHVEKLNSAEYAVTAVRKGERRRKPAAPFTTSTLQQEASRKYRFGTGKTMRIAQQLYEGVDLGAGERIGLITYMRTDSVTVSTDAQAEARKFIEDNYSADYLPAKPPVYKTKSKSAQEAHEAIRPTSVMHVPTAIKKKLSADQYKLYRLIWLRFLASQMPPAVYNTVSADIMAGEAATAPKKRPYLFRATGSTIKFLGFLRVYEETSPTDRPDGDANQVPADLSVAELLNLVKLLPEQHFTQPPPRFSEATLVKALEEDGIGRPSTYASIISTIIARGYVERESRRLFATPTGMLVTDLLVEHFPDLLSVDFTARLEAHLDDIAGGDPWVPVVDRFYKEFAIALEIADEKIPKTRIEAPIELAGRDCPTCGEPLLFREGRFGRFIGCSGFPKCRYTEQVLVKTGTVCPRTGSDIIEKRTRKGRIFYGCSRYPDCEWVSWKAPVKDAVSPDGIIVQQTKSTTKMTPCGIKEGVSLEIAAEKV